MDYKYIIYEKKDRVAHITINRPEVMNAIHPPASRELSEVLDDFDRDEDCWAAVITGAGDRAFSAGNDLKYQAQMGPERMAEERGKIGKGGFGGITARFDCFKPIIAAVNGLALGGGFEIVLATDIVIAAEHATFGLPEPAVGLIPGAGGVHRLPRHIPLKLAMGMMMTGRRLTAPEARDLGLVNEVVPAKELMPTVGKWISQMFALAPLSLRAIKQCVIEGGGLPLEEAFLKKKYSIQDLLPQTEDYIEGPKAFAEKRKPRWQGK